MKIDVGVSGEAREILVGPRVESYRVDLLDQNNRRVGELNGVEGGKVTQNVDSNIRGGLKLDLLDIGEPIDWMKARFQPWVWVNDLEWPLGVFLPSNPDDEYSTHGRRWSVSCVDKLSILDESGTTQTYGVPLGTNLVDLAESVIKNMAGENDIVKTPSTSLSKYAMTWEAGTSVLRIVNDLLSAANYFSVWCDGYGQYRLEPYVKPQDRTPVFEFVEGQTAIHTPNLTRSQNISEVPNRVVVLTQGTDEEPAISAFAENTDPSSPYSYQARGNRWVTQVYTGAEASDEATLQELAIRYLRGATNPVATYKVEHAVVPLDPNNIVRLVHQGIEVRASVNEYSVDLKAGSLMSSLWYEVTEW